MVLPYINMNPPQVYTCSPSWTLLLSSSLYHPSGLSQCTSPKQPVSCIEPGLVTRFTYDIIHVSMPFSQIIPPSPSPTESKRLLYSSVSLVPQLSYPFICWWTSRLLPCPGYYKLCCDEHWGAHVSFNSGFPGVYAQKWDCWVIRQFYFQFFKESPHCSP